MTTIKELTTYFNNPAHISSYKNWEDLISHRITNNPAKIKTIVNDNRLYVYYDLEYTQDFINKYFHCYSTGYSPSSAINNAKQNLECDYNHNKALKNTTKKLNYIRQNLDLNHLEMWELKSDYHQSQFILIQKS